MIEQDNAVLRAALREIGESVRFIVPLLGGSIHDQRIKCLVLGIKTKAQCALIGTATAEPQHVCGARGFGYASDDTCPACEANRHTAPNGGSGAVEER